MWDMGDLLGNTMESYSMKFELFEVRQFVGVVVVQLSLASH
jgi:hypothetical protein